VNKRTADAAEKADKPLISFPEGSLIVRFCRREKRFIVEVEMDEKRFQVHCNNSGSMMGLLRPGSQLLISPALKPGRKLPYTLEMAKPQDVWVGVNTLVPNRVLYLAWKTGLLSELTGYERYRSEAVVGESRLDAMLQGDRGTLWVEAKNVTLVEDDVAYFPDAISLRGQKHLRELMALAHKGHRAACFYLIQREDARCFAPADFIDPAFADLFWQARAKGVEMWPYKATASSEGIRIGPPLPLLNTSEAK